jgi:hypothetical protein
LEKRLPKGLRGLALKPILGENKGVALPLKRSLWMLFGLFKSQQKLLD